MNNWFKRNSTHLIIVAILIIISFAYFFSPLMQGKALQQGDVVRAQGMQKEIMDYRAKTGHEPLWTNSMFGGMPSYQIHVLYPNNITSYVIQVTKAIFPNPVDTILICLLGAYLLLCVLKVNPWLSAAGAIAFAFSSYNFILIEAGHANQIYAIAFFAPILAGIFLTLQGRYWVGSALTALFLAMEIRANHIQMTYYLLLAILVLVIIEFYHAVKDKKLPQFGKSVAFLAIATVLAVAVNASMLWTTAEYGKETNRGQSNLTQHTDEPSNGLSKDYAYAWSQGVSECFTFLIPNAYGGASGVTALDVPNAKVTKALTDKNIPQDQAENAVQQLEGYGVTTYWGGKQFTSGPFYFGAVICFLFVLGLIVVKDRIKWWLLATVILTMFLSFGRNFPLISDLFFKYFPMYNKFRAVESILAVAELCFPILALLAVQEIIRSNDKAVILKKTLLAFYITGGITLLLIAVPSIFLSFKAPEHQAIIGTLSQLFKGDTAMATSVMNGLVQDRMALERNDAIRSLIFIAIAMGLLWAFIKDKIKLPLAAIALLVLVLVDLWAVDRRYLNDQDFVAKEDYDQPVRATEIDQFILRDKDPDFRVFDLSQGSPFTNANTSYFFKSVGGYHAAKLKRFDELMDNFYVDSVINGQSQHIRYNPRILDMLNTKYVINADPKTGAPSMEANPTACGNAWFVKNVTWVDDADHEMDALKSSAFLPKETVIIDKQYKSLVNEKGIDADPNAVIKLTSYEPEHLKYETSSASPQIAVFSEIYYKAGWKMLIDGVETPYFRADYLLRAAQIPMGNHKIDFIFHPESYYTGETISLAGSVLLVLALGGAAYAGNKKKKEDDKQ